MPFPRRFFKRLFLASLNLLVIVIPFTTMAIPVITKEFSRSSTPATDAVSSKLTGKQIFDIVFGIVLFVSVFGLLAWLGGYPFPPLMLVDWLDAVYRPVRDAVAAVGLRALFRRAADGVVDTDGTPPAPQTLGGDTSTNPVHTASHMQDVEPEPDPFSTARPYATSTSDDSNLTSPSSAQPLHHHCG